MPWEHFVLVHALIGMAWAFVTIRRPAHFALLFGTVLLWLIPYMWYWLAAYHSNSRDEFGAWSLLFVVPAGLAGCSVLWAVRLGKFLKNRKHRPDS